MCKRLIIIPARGNSKRIKNKNIRDFFGSPILIHSIKNAHTSQLFSEIHVSTDSDQIYKIAKLEGFEPAFKRPVKLSDDVTPLMPVLEHVINEFSDRKKIFDEIWVLMPCSPLVTSKDLIDASKEFKKIKKGTALMAVSKYPVPIEWAFRINDDNVLESNDLSQQQIRSQDLKDAFHDAGSLYIFKPCSIINHQAYGNGVEYSPFQLPRKKSVDVDSIEDWAFMETLFLGENQKDLLSQNQKRLFCLKTSLEYKINETIKLKCLLEGDFKKEYLDGINDEEVRFFLSSSIQTEETLIEYISYNRLDNTSLLLGIFYNNNHIGNIRLSKISWIEKSASVGICIFGKRYWGRGVGSKSLQASLELATSILGLTSFTAGINIKNHPSQMVFKKNGFVLTHSLEESLFFEKK